MGWNKERINEDGKIRYQAMYRDHRGHERSAGTYSTEKQVDKATRHRNNPHRDALSCQRLPLDVSRVRRWQVLLDADRPALRSRMTGFRWVSAVTRRFSSARTMGATGGVTV